MYYCRQIDDFIIADLFSLLDVKFENGKVEE